MESHFFNLLLKEIKRMATAVENLTASVASLTSAVGAAVTALDDIAAKLAAAIAAGNTDPAVQAAADSITSLSQGLSDAVARDDPPVA